MIINLTQPAQAVRADYEYSIVQHAAAPTLQIIDLNLGEMSVTNDLPNVLREIWRLEGAHYDLLQMVVSYRDSQGDWDFVEVLPIEGRTNVYQVAIKPGYHRVAQGIR